MGLEEVDWAGPRLFDDGADPTQLIPPPHPPTPASEMVSIELPSRDFPSLDY